MNVRVTEWRTRDGKLRRIRLYKAYMNMRERVAGIQGSNGVARWKGLHIGFINFAHFRHWALGAGYSRVNCSLDRIDSSKGYVEDNLRWVPICVNSGRAYANHKYATCRCTACERKRGPA